jgi:hypothetical protein
MAINRGIAEAETISRFGTNGLNDKADAFRHAYFNALNTRSATLAVVGDGAKVVRRFGEAHETEVPSQLQLEVQMDLHNNEVGIQYCSDCYPGFTTDQTISNGIMQLLLNGSLNYLFPTLPPPFFSDGTPNPNGDPNFYGANGTNDLQTATHGITSSTQIIPTNQ